MRDAAHRRYVKRRAVAEHTPPGSKTGKSYQHRRRGTAIDHTTRGAAAALHNITLELGAAA